MARLIGVQGDLWNDFAAVFPTERALASAALALGADKVSGFSAKEAALAAGGKTPARAILHALIDAIREGYDPMGDAFCALRTPATRREHGATYTPMPIVQTMIDWARVGSPSRIIDPGVGSARFLMRAAAAFPQAQLIGVDIDPLATLIARANLAVLGVTNRTRITLGDYREFEEPIAGRTLYVGNPPYVRHHQIAPRWKDWLFSEASNIGLNASKLAGLHVYFYLATAIKARAKDYGAFITASEWLDVNYGALVRNLILNKLGGQSVTVIEPTAQPFPDAATTAAITTFEIAAKPKSIFFQRIDKLENLSELGNGRPINRERLAVEPRWSFLTHPIQKAPDGYVELGELCRVHRGTVTGANEVWIEGEHSAGLPTSVMFPTVTRARDVLDAEGVLADPAKLRRVIDLPRDLDELDAAERRAVTQFLSIARKMGANSGYVASHRKAWWSIGLRKAAPILSTYMARRPPAFVMNQVGARHINIAHGLYPRDEMSEGVKQALVDFLQSNVSQRSGRTYAGGLTKFEPREMERVFVPGPELLAAAAT
ncbi:MAG: Eco57I restriction-modification methylase domain-containing protein [Cypionkella sp.]